MSSAACIHLCMCLLVNMSTFMVGIHLRQNCCGIQYADAQLLDIAKQFSRGVVPVFFVLLYHDRQHVMSACPLFEMLGLLTWLDGSHHISLLSDIVTFVITLFHCKGMLYRYLKTCGMIFLR